MPNHSRWLVANWKLQGCKDDLHALYQHVQAYQGVDFQAHWIITPPMVYVAHAVSLFKDFSHIHVAAPTVSHYAQGPWTGRVSASMLADIGCTHVLLGHQERLWERDDLFERLQQAHGKNLRTIICWGDDRTQALVSMLKDCPQDHVLLAYEPSRSIGQGGQAAPLASVENFVQSLRSQGVRCPVLYGGSVSGDNIQSFWHCGHLQGVLLGRASFDYPLQIQAVTKNFAKE